MGAKRGLMVVGVALGLLLGWLVWRDGGQPAEGVRARPAAVEVVPAAAPELESLRATEVAGERVSLENTPRSAEPLAANGEVTAPGASGVWVKVVDEQLAPLGDVRVALRSARKPHGKPESMGTSDAKGLVWLDMQLEADPNERRVEPAGPRPRVDGVTFDPAQLGEEPVLLVLNAGAGLDVHVIDERGASVEGALVRLVSPADHDGVFGGLDAIDAAVMAYGQVRDGTCSFARLPADTDLLLHVQGPLPLGPMSVRTRTPGAGQRSRVDARYSADDVVLLGEFRGDFTDTRWRWSLFDPTAEGPAAMKPTIPLHVADDGRFVVRLTPDVVGALGPAVCLVVHRASGLLEAVELPPLTGAGVVRLEPMDAALSNLCTGTVYFDPDGDPATVQLSVSGIRSPEDPTRFSAVRMVRPDARGQFSFHGRGPAGWSWEMQCISRDWEVAEPAAFPAGATDHRVRLVRVGGPTMVRLVPGPALAASTGWPEHLVVQMHSSDGMGDSFPFVEPDGRFQIFGALDDVTKVSVRARWHERPILEWDLVPGGTLELELPPALRLVRLDVRGEGGAPLAAKAVDPKDNGAAWYQRRAESPLVVLLDLSAQDVLVQADGYRDTLVPAVSEDRRVDLAERGVSLILRASDLPELPEEFRLRPLLTRGTEAAPDFRSRLEFDSQGIAAVVASGAGEFHVHLQLERVTPSMRAVQIIAGEDSPRIQVAEPTDGQAPAEFPVTFDSAKILAALATMR